jgi:hypothetical protein
MRRNRNGRNVQPCPVGTSQTDGKNWGLVWRNSQKISQIIKDYFHLPFFLLIILWAEDWLGNNVDKAQDKDRDEVRKISITGQKDKTQAERLEIRSGTDSDCE